MKEVCCWRTRQNLLPSLCLFQHPSLDVYIGFLVVYKEYNLRVIGSASLPACVWMQWMSSLHALMLMATHSYGVPDSPLTLSALNDISMLLPKIVTRQADCKCMSLFLCGVYWHYLRQMWTYDTTVASSDGPFFYNGFLFFFVLFSLFALVTMMAFGVGWQREPEGKNCCSFRYWCVPKADIFIL